MSHRHFCDEVGHEYDCSSADCECICGLLMEEGDHSECPIELRACPEHKPEQDRRMAEAMLAAEGCASFENGNEPLPPLPHCDCGCADIQGESVGFCLWCSHSYQDYSPAIENQHFAHHCPNAPQELKDAALARLQSSRRNVH